MKADWGSFGLAIGHATDEVGATGLTVVRGVGSSFRAGVAITGRATGTRDIGTLAPDHVTTRTDAILLTGGSAYGLDAASGVMSWMEERARGFYAGGGVVPIVPAAVIFDLSPCGSFSARPTAEMAYQACEVASGKPVREGSIGAGTGATVGKCLGVEHAMKGGVGCWHEEGGDFPVAALAVVNSLGDVRDDKGRIIAGARRADGTFLDCAATLRASARGMSFDGLAGRNTTLAVVAVGAVLTRMQLTQVAKAASAAITRRTTPAATSFDGDVVFAICPLEAALTVAPPLLHVEAAAEYVLGAAIERAVRMSRGRDGVAGLADEKPS